MANWAKNNALHPDIGGHTTSSKLTTYAVATESVTPIEVSSGTYKATLVPTFNDGCPNTTIATDCTTLGKYGDGSKGRIVYMTRCPADTDWTTEQGNGFTGCYDVLWDDCEYGCDYDLDIAARHYTKVSGTTLTVKTRGQYAAAGNMGYAGYFISGVSAPGVYYDIRCGTGDGNAARPGYNGCQKYDGTGGHDTDPKTISIVRTFTMTNTGASLLHDPLWYAAKYGGFDDIGTKNSDGTVSDTLNGKPDIQGEWDQNNNGVPDTYFYASNPLQLEARLGSRHAKHPGQGGFRDCRVCSCFLGREWREYAPGGFLSKKVF